MTHALLLDLLLRAGAPVTVDALSRATGIKRNTVLDELERLRDAGCTLESHPQHGVRLIASGLGVWRDYLTWRWPSRIVEIYRSTSSTQDAARRIVEQRGAASNGAIAIADEQIAGRGRLGRRWTAPPGTAVTFSMVVLVADSRQEADRLTFAASVAVARALDAQIKWPNDVMIAGRKIAGILVESFNTAAGLAYVIGVGINVSLDPEALEQIDSNLPQRVTSLRACGRHVDRLAVLSRTAAELDDVLSRQDLAPLLDDWRRRSVLLSHHVTLSSNGRQFRGHVVDLDPRDGLILRTDSGELVHLHAATTTILHSA